MKTSKLAIDKIKPTCNIPTQTIESPSSSWYINQGEQIIKEQHAEAQRQAKQNAPNGTIN